MNIISWIPPAQDWFSKTFPNTDIRWFNLAFILVFILVMYWILHELYKKLEESENKKPSILVIPRKKDLRNDIFIDVENKGEKGTLSAQVAIKDCNFDKKWRPTVEYMAVWAISQTHKSELFRGHSDRLWIATVKPQASGGLLLHTYDVVSNRIGSWISTNSAQPEYILQIKISSDPSLCGGLFCKYYKVNLTGVEETNP